MKNATALAALLDGTAASPTAHGTSTIGWFIVSILGISVALLILFYCGLSVIGFVGYGIAPLSYAAMWMSSIGIVAAGSLFSLLQMIAMGGISVFMVLLCIIALVALAVGALEAIAWLVHLWNSGAIHVPTWLVGSWDSATAWLAHLWDSATAWLAHLWDSIPVHHKWKILYT